MQYMSGFNNRQNKIKCIIEKFGSYFKQVRHRGSEFSEKNMYVEEKK